MNRLIKFLLTAVLCLPLLAQGQAKVGTAGLQFLKVGVCARAVGMGEAFTAVANDASAIYYNPAGIIQMTNPEAGFSYIDYPAGLKFVHIGGVWPTPQINGVIGIQATSLYTDDMIETTPETPYGTGRTFSASDLALGVTYCQRLTDKFSVGASFKYLNERLADASANGWAVDVGTFYTTGWKRVNIGMVIQNFGPDMKFVQTPFPLPITFKFGASMVAWESGMYDLIVAGEFIHPNDNLEVYVVGAELNVMRMISFRMGKRLNAWQRDTWDAYQKDPQKDPFVEFPVLDEDGKISLDGFSVGLGLHIPEAGVNFDYAWSGLGTLGPVHRFTVGYKLNAVWF
ncbi:MAG: PorV/PorQ family protein [Calditrichota bacterium]